MSRARGRYNALDKRGQVRDANVELQGKNSNCWCSMKSKFFPPQIQDFGAGVCGSRGVKAGLQTSLGLSRWPFGWFLRQPPIPPSTFLWGQSSMSPCFSSFVVKLRALFFFPVSLGLFYFVTLFSMFNQEFLFVCLFVVRLSCLMFGLLPGLNYLYGSI